MDCACHIINAEVSRLRAPRCPTLYDLAYNAIGNPKLCQDAGCYREPRVRIQHIHKAVFTIPYGWTLVHAIVPKEERTKQSDVEHMHCVDQFSREAILQSQGQTNVFSITNGSTCFCMNVQSFSHPLFTVRYLQLCIVGTANIYIWNAHHQK